MTEEIPTRILQILRRAIRSNECTSFETGVKLVIPIRLDVNSSRVRVMLRNAFLWGFIPEIVWQHFDRFRLSIIPERKGHLFQFLHFSLFPMYLFFKERSIIEKFTAWRVKSTLNFTLKTDITRIAFLESHNWIKIRKKHTLIVLFVFILSARPQKAISKSTVRTVITSANRKQGQSYTFESSTTHSTTLFVPCACFFNCFQTSQTSLTLS